MVSAAFITTYYDLRLKPGAGYSRDVLPTVNADDRASGTGHGLIVSKLTPETWSIRFPQGASTMQVLELQTAFQLTAKGMLPMTWTPPGDSEQVVVFLNRGLNIAPISAARCRVSDITLAKWVG